MTNYNPWPLGHIPNYLQRHELFELKSAGYKFTDPREVVTLFENKVARFAGSKYAVAVDCCTHAIELCLRHLHDIGDLNWHSEVAIPKHTYISVHQTMGKLFEKHALEDIKWSGIYPIISTNVIDGAARWEKGMFVKQAFHCLSFQIKKAIPIGRGGMVLTDDKDAADWIRLASYDGRDLTTPYDSPDHVKMNGYHYYMTPEDAARGIILMDAIDFEGDTMDWSNYPEIK